MFPLSWPPPPPPLRRLTPLHPNSPVISRLSLFVERGINTLRHRWGWFRVSHATLHTMQHTQCECVWVHANVHACNYMPRMRVCECICILNVRVNVCVHDCFHKFVVCACMCMCAHVCTCTYMHVYVRVCKCMCTHTSVGQLSMILQADSWDTPQVGWHWLPWEHNTGSLSGVTVSRGGSRAVGYISLHDLTRK